LSSDEPDPLKFIDLKKDEIIFRLTDEENYTEEEALASFIFITEIIQNLSELRLCTHKTFHYLEKTLIKPPVRNKNFIINFLLKATIGNDTYARSFNYLASLLNRDLVVPIKLKKTADHEIMSMIEKERSGAELKNRKVIPVRPALSINEVALKCVWEETPVTLQNMDELAGRYGFKSGYKFYTSYNFWAKKVNRIADPEGKIKIKNKIELFERVLKIISLEYRQKALDELKILQNINAEKYLDN